MNLKDKIQKMIDLGFTYGQLGKICECHSSSISSWMRGASNISKRMEELQVEMEKALEGKTTEEQQKVMTEYSAKAQLLQSEAQNKLKSSLDNALHQVAKEKGLGAILYKDAVPQGGTDVTQAVIDKMK